MRVGVHGKLNKFKTSGNFKKKKIPKNKLSIWNIYSRTRKQSLRKELCLLVWDCLSHIQQIKQSSILTTVNAKTASDEITSINLPQQTYLKTIVQSVMTGLKKVLPKGEISSQLRWIFYVRS